MFHVKICGITSGDDARAAVAAGADAIGLNFWEQSRRHVSVERAMEIAQRVREAAEVSHRKALVVGVFVNAERDFIAQAARQVGLDAVQLHGDESPERAAEISAAIALPVVRVFRIGRELGGIAPVLDDLARCRALNFVPAAALIDAASGGHYGGTGQPADWPLAAELRAALAMPTILAGGLTPENVAQAIAAVGPFGVDTASGVEQSPGVKDREAMQNFVRNAKTKLAATR